jgi:putative ABC transport system permease protein
VVGFTAGLAALTCILFGLVPALHAARTDVGVVLKAHAPSAGGGRWRVRRALVVVQVALSFVLAVTALLFARSFQNLAAIDTGFRVSGVLLLDVDLQKTDVPAERLAPLKRQLLQRVRDEPAVERAAQTFMTPMSGGAWNEHIWLEGVQPRHVVDTFFNRVSPGYFDALGTPLLAGRDFRDGDGVGQARVAIISQALARDWFGDASPLGHRFRIPANSDEPETRYEIVGVVADSKYLALREQVRDTGTGGVRPVDFMPLAFLPAGQEPRPEPWTTLLVRSSAPRAELVRSLERAVVEAAPSAVLDYRPLDEQIRDTLVTERMLAALSIFFGLLATLLAGIGLYGVIAYSVARRTHEIGVRMALGATRGRVAALFLGEAIRLLATGLAAGAVLALVATRAARALLYGLAPHDPASLVLAGLLLAAITCIATVLPAWRASAVDPMTALREE